MPRIRRRAFDRVAIILESCLIGAARNTAVSSLCINDAAA